MILPKWYYYRGGTSDRDKIIACMRHIPVELQQEIIDKYESLYLMNGHVNVTEGRAAANKYLGDKARAFRGNLVQQGQALYQHNQETNKTALPAKQGKMPSKYNGKILRDAGLK